MNLRFFSATDGSGPGLIVFTNNNGEFQLTNLAAGKYYLALEGPGVAMQSGFGMRIPLPMTAIPRAEDFPEIVPRHDATFTVDGTNSAEVEVRVERGGTLTGKVMKSNGAAAANVSVSLISRKGSKSGPFMAQFSAPTNKDGVYKLEHLPPGQYLVAAVIQSKTPDRDILSRIRGQSQITYHPAAINVNQAATVDIGSGRETMGVNITLVERSSFSVSGNVLRQRDGSPVAGATVLLQNKETESVGPLVPGFNQRSTRTDSEGRWAFINVQEGSYVVLAVDSPTVTVVRSSREIRSDRPPYRDARPPLFFAQKEINLSGADLPGLSLVIVGPGSIFGSVEIEGGERLPPGLVIFFDVMYEGSRPGRPIPVQVQADGSFLVESIQGGQMFLSAGFPRDGKYFVKSITAGGADLRATPLTVNEGAQAGPIKITLSAKVAFVAGRIINEGTGQPVAGHAVLLVPVETEKRRFRTSTSGMRTGPAGNYSITAAPGEYFVLIRREDEMPPMITEEFVQFELSKAPRVTLQPGEQKQMDFRVP